MKRCTLHPESPLFADKRCKECSRLWRRARRAVLRKQRGPKPLSPRQKALRAGHKYYIGRPCVRHGQRALRWVRGGGCMACHREFYPRRQSAQTRRNKLIYMREYARRRATAFRVMRELGGGPPLGF
jgi:hypothetical protein